MKPIILIQQINYFSSTVVGGGVTVRFQQTEYSVVEADVQLLVCVELNFTVFLGEFLPPTIPLQATPINITESANSATGIRYVVSTV